MKIRLVIFIMLLSFTSACLPLEATTKDNSGDECIPSLYDVAVPIVTPQVKNDIITPRKILPKGDWQSQGSLPFSQDESGYILYMRPKHNELLFTGKFDDIYFYSIDKGQWETYQKPDNWMLGRLFLANDGTIWGPVLQIKNNGIAEKSHPLLSQFNDATGQFEYVEDVSGFLKVPQVRIISNIVEDQSGLLWFFVESDNNTLVSFDTKSRKSEEHFSFEIAGGNPDVVIGLDGSIWFQDFFNEEFVQYIPSTQDTRTYKAFPEQETSVEMSPGFDKANYIFMDHSGRLWIANYAWLDFSENNSPQWYRVIESPVFLTDQSPFGQYRMAYQVSTYQSSNGWYWFTGANGIVRLDMEKGTWCLMTTGISKVVEDDDNNLWIAVFGKLYKYPLNP